MYAQPKCACGFRRIQPRHIASAERLCGMKKGRRISEAFASIRALLVLLLALLVGNSAGGLALAAAAVSSGVLQARGLYGLDVLHYKKLLSMRGGHKSTDEISICARAQGPGNIWCRWPGSNRHAVASGGF